MGRPVESWASSDVTRASMKGNRSRDTLPELALRREVHRLGLRYRVAVRPLPGLRRTADLVFRSTKIAVFMDGCFWHGCPDHHTAANRNSEYWAAKVAGNKARDKDTDQHLRQAGWLVVRFWEHDNPWDAAQQVLVAVQSRRASLSADAGE